MADDGPITGSAPGSVMLLGEHAVLHNHRALVCAVNRRIHVQLLPTTSNTVKITSALGEYESSLTSLTEHPSFRFVVQAIRQQLGHLPAGFELSITSEFRSDIGFGSSAAVTVATHGVLMEWIMGDRPPLKALFDQSFKTVQAVQGRGSGADLAASVYGGILGYRSGNVFASFTSSLPLTAVYCGYKTPTAEVISRVNYMSREDPGKYERIYNEIDQGVEDAVQALKGNDLPALGGVLNQQHRLMDEMGVNTHELEEIVNSLRSAPDIYGAKISGSGLGDCAIGLGHTDLTELEYPVHHLEISSIGYQ